MLFVHGPPTEGAGQWDAEPIRCTSNVVLPLVDTLVGLAAGGVAGAVASGEVDGVDGGGVLGAAVAGGAGGAGAAYLVSALSGWVTTKRCRNAKAAQAERPASWETHPAMYRPNVTLPRPEPAPARPMECVADVDCGVGRMCEYGQCQALRVTR